MAFAQSSALQPKFGIGLSLGLPSSSIHFFARDIGIKGFAFRADAGGFAFMISYVQFAVNAEYHFAELGGVGVYFGVGLFAFKGIGYSSTFPSNEYPWLFGVLGSVGFELGALFLEVGWMQSVISSDSIDSRSSPRGIIGLQFYFKSLSEKVKLRSCHLVLKSFAV